MHRPPPSTFVSAASAAAGSAVGRGRAAVRSRLGPWMLFCFVLTLGLALGLPPETRAHTRSISYSSWEIDLQGGAEVTLRLKLLELSRLGPEALPPDQLPRSREHRGSSGRSATEDATTDPNLRALPQLLTLRAESEPCAVPDRARRLPDEPGWVRYRWRVVCPAEAASLTLQSRLLLDVAPSHLHFARVRLDGVSETIHEQVLTEAEPEFVIRSRQPSPSGEGEPALGSRFVDYLALGVDHILGGWDHLAFVFGLLLLSSRFGEVARLVTGFTLAHSLTLALAVFDRVHPRGEAVEAVIAFSVALVAIEKGWLLSGRHRAIPIALLAGLLALAGAAALGSSSLPLQSVLGLLVFTACYLALVDRHRSGWLRISLTFAFGLVHGFGFAGILMEMTLPNERLVPALLGFNLGVEIGQIGLVLVLWPLILLAGRVAPAPLLRWGSELSATALCGLGLYWLVLRAFPL